jgi:hypothetical protein
MKMHAFHRFGSLFLLHLTALKDTTAVYFEKPQLQAMSLWWTQKVSAQASLEIDVFNKNSRQLCVSGFDEIEYAFQA